MQLFPHQIQGKDFLASRRAAMLADDPRVGKTAPSIRAAEDVYAQNILVVTKATARGDWGRQLRAWGYNRRPQVIYKGDDKLSPDCDAVVVGWGMVYSPGLREQLMAKRWGALIIDEAHEARGLNTKRTQAVYGTVIDGGRAVQNNGLCHKALFTWPLSGSIIANAPNDLYPMVRSLAPHRLAANAAKGWPDVTLYADFVARYCVVRRRQINGVWRDVIKGGKNEAELSERLKGFGLRRTQKQVGMREPIFSLLGLSIEKHGAKFKEVSEHLEPLAAEVITAAEQDNTAELEALLAPIRRVTGTLKAYAAAALMRDELDDGLDRVVLMAWHKDVLDILCDELSDYGVSRLDGSTPAEQRDKEIADFQSGKNRVFAGQIAACGEAADLSISNNLVFVEISTVPKDMKQASLRVTNLLQTRQALVRVCCLENSIDEALCEIVIRKVRSINKITEGMHAC